VILFNVKVEFPRDYDPGDEIGKQRLRQWGPAMGAQAALATFVRKRVRRRGETVQPFKGYSRKGFRRVATGYPLPSAPSGFEESGAAIYGSSADFHAGVVKGSFNVSGGMWRGLFIRVSGSSKATASFRGRSPGYSIAADKVVQNDKTGKVRLQKGRVKGRKESNALKAKSVLEKTEVSLLDMFRGERVALGDGINQSLASVVAPSFGITVQRHRGARGEARLRREIIRAIRKNRRRLG